MPRALILHYKPAEALPLAERVPKAFRGIRENPPAVIVIDLMRMPSYGRAMGVLLRQSKSLRAIPVVFVEGDPEKSDLVSRTLPGAIVAPWDRLGPALRRAIASQPAAPRPPAPHDTPLLRKLRISEGSVIALLHEPKGIRAKLSPLPKRARIQLEMDGADKVIVFFKSMAALSRELPSLANSMRRGMTLWIVWPKKAGNAAGDLSAPAIWEMCRSYRLAVGRVCAFDETWSALAFTRRDSAKKNRAPGLPEARL